MKRLVLVLLALAAGCDRDSLEDFDRCAEACNAATMDAASRGASSPNYPVLCDEGPAWCSCTGECPSVAQ